jgi:addiction module RelE/StbE family toxin
MARVIWTPEVLENLENIADYHLTVASGSATRVLSKILDAMEAVESYPRIGRQVPGFDRDDLRERIVENYRVVYQIVGETIFIITARHASMNVEAWLRSRGF